MIRPSVNVTCSLIQCGSSSQPAAWRHGTTKLRQVSASLAIVGGTTQKVKQPAWLFSEQQTCYCFALEKAIRRMSYPLNPNWCYRISTSTFSKPKVFPTGGLGFGHSRNRWVQQTDLDARMAHPQNRGMLVATIRQCLWRPGNCDDAMDCVGSKFALWPYRNGCSRGTRGGVDRSNCFASFTRRGIQGRMNASVSS